MKILRLSSVFAILLILAACVTINIYFPSAEAEEAAEKIVDDILGKDTESMKGEKGSFRIQPVEDSVVQSHSILDWLIPSAHAAQPNFDISSPQVRKFQASMKKRHPSLSPYYRSGAIGYTNQGLVKVRDASAIPLKVRKKVKSAVNAENGDRNGLYRAIANANGHPEWEADIRATFAKKWVQKAASGWWYQTTKGQWKAK